MLQALIWVLASGHLVVGSAHHHPTGGASTSWTVWGSRPITSNFGLKPIFGNWIVRPSGVTILHPAAGSFASKPISGSSWGPLKPINTVASGAGSKLNVGLEVNSKWGPMAGTSAYKWSHSRPGSSSYQSVNFSYKMKPRPSRPTKPHPPYKPPSVTTKPTQPPVPTLPTTPPPQPTLPPSKPPTQPTNPPSRPPPSTTPPTLPDFLLPSPLLPLEDIDLPSGGAPTVLRPPSRLSPSGRPANPSNPRPNLPQSPFSPPCRPGIAPPCRPPTLSIFLP